MDSFLRALFATIDLSRNKNVFPGFSTWINAQFVGKNSAPRFKYEAIIVIFILLIPGGIYYNMLAGHWGEQVDCNSLFSNLGVYIQGYVIIGIGATLAIFIVLAYHKLA